MGHYEQHRRTNISTKNIRGLLAQSRIGKIYQLALCIHKRSISRLLTNTEIHTETFVRPPNMTGTCHVQRCSEVWEAGHGLPASQKASERHYRFFKNQNQEYLSEASKTVVLKPLASFMMPFHSWKLMVLFLASSMVSL